MIRTTAASGIRSSIMAVFTFFCTSQAAFTTNFGNYGGSYSANGNKVVISCAMSSTGTVAGHTVNATMPALRLTICTPSIIRVEYDPTGLFSPDPATLVGDPLCTWNTNSFTPAYSNDFLAADFNKREWPFVSFTHQDSADAIVIETSTLHIRVTKTPVRVQYIRKSDNVLLAAEDPQTANSCTMNDNSLNAGSMGFKRTTDEHLFGWSMPWWTRYDESYWNLFEITGKVAPLSYAFEPVFFSTRGYGIFPFCLSLNAGNPIKIGFGGNNNRPYFGGQGDMASTQYLTYYFFNCASYGELLDGYTQVTGRPPLMNKKYYGVHKVCFRNFEQYSNISALLPVWKNYVDLHRRLGHHLDVVTFDGFTQWDAVGQTNMEALRPGMTELLNYGKSNKIIMGASVGVMCVNDSNRSNPPKIQTVERAAVAMDHGFSFIWYDAMGTYSYTQSKRIWDTFKSAAKLRGIDTSMVYVRYGWSNILGHSMPSGHDGDHLDTKVGTATPCPHAFMGQLTYSLGGAYFNATDLGEGKWNIVSSVLRPCISFHTEGRAGCTPYAGFFNSPWDTATDVTKAELARIFRKQFNVHYRFIPYLFSYGCRASLTGMPVWRPMFFFNLNDPTMYNLKLQSYVGNELVQAAYYEGAPDCAANGVRNNIKLPGGTWYDYWDGTRHDGPKTVDNYQCGTTPENMRLPLFVKAGAIIPLMPEMTYIGQKLEDPMTLQIWPSGNSSFELWEDEKGTRTTFSCQQTANQAMIGIPMFKGSSYSPATRKYVLEVHGSTKPQKVVRMSDMSELPELASKVAFNSATSGWFFDQSQGGICYVKPITDNTKDEQIAVSYTGQVVGTSSNFMGGARIAVRMTRSPLTNRYSVTITGPGSVGIRAFSPAGRMVASVKGMRSVSLALPQGLFVVQTTAGDKIYSTQMMRGE